ncbi:hypothetical protein HK097_005765 [Rhizophlyctis rosea]|uniref:G-protein coupled receptors family 3 profile domain-containing protein n=1 Tax=Rhizophlyctis rosea TaxID=64517 RepID=A0AAD5X4T1_9FUNG|nr:hypothetical protein HK097_005765 [Rhizophlyctis rosea]
MEGFTKDGNSIGTLPVGTHKSNAYYYLVGQTSAPPVELWEPFGNGSPDNHVDILTSAMAELVLNNRDSAGKDTVSFKLRVGDWGVVSSIAICGNETQPCPDVLILGTTQIAARVAGGDLEPLGEYFEQAVLQGESMPSDDFPRGALYDYYYDGQWYGVPYNSDIRALYYNINTFTSLGLSVPPQSESLGTWGHPYFKTWTWEAMMDQAKAIKDATGKPAFFFPALWDEETKIVAAVARNYGAQIITKDHVCGLTSPAFKKMLNEVFVRMYLRDKSASMDFMGTDLVNAFLAKPPPADPLDYDAMELCCQNDITYPQHGFTIVSPSDTAKYPAGELQMAYMPGRNTFLGGAGLTMTKGGKNKMWAWKLISTITSHERSYLMDVANYMDSVPPSDYFLGSEEKYKSGDGLTLKILMGIAIPPQYPLASFPQYSDMEMRKPIRILLYELIFRKLTIDEATSRACRIIDFIFSPSCNSSHWVYTQSPVNEIDGTISIDFAWHSAAQCKLEGAESLPKSISNIKIQHFPTTNTAAIAILGATLAVSLVHVVYLAAVIWYKNQPAIKRASFIFSAMIVLGGLLTHGFIYCIVGTPTHITCVARTWFLVMGFTLCFGGLTLKTYRIHAIFNIATKKARKGFKMTDYDLLKLFAVLAAIEIGLLINWTFWGNPDPIMQVYSTKL